MAAETPDPSSASSEQLAIPSRNPMPLSASQEAQVRDVYYKRVRQLCAKEIQDFAACAAGKTFSVTFACKPEHRAMNNCMKLRATREEHDAAREEWFAMRQERQKKREHKAKVAAAQEEFMREWWGLPEDVRLSKRRELEQQQRQQQGERIGGMPAADRPRVGDAKDR